MRHLFRGLAVAAITAVFTTLAIAGNQEVAELIAKNLRESGKLTDYKIGVKYQDGTAWLSGRVRDAEQMGAALEAAFTTPDVTRVVNNLEIGKSEPAPAEAALPSQASESADAGSTLRFGNVAGRVLPVAATQPVTPALAPPSEEPRELEFVDRGNAEQIAPRQTLPQPSAAQRNARRPIPIAYTQPVPAPQGVQGQPQPMYTNSARSNVAPVKYDQPCLPNYAWPSYSAYPNYATVNYPTQYSPTCWPYIGPFYPYPQVPPGWRKVTLEWDNGWWWLDFKDTPRCHPGKCW